MIYTPRQITFIIAGVCELYFAIPVIGWLTMIGLMPIMPLAILGLHALALILAKKEEKNVGPPILGIVTSMVAWVPIIGWLMHIVTALFYLFEFIIKVDATSENKQEARIIDKEEVRDAEIVDEPATASTR